MLKTSYVRYSYGYLKLIIFMMLVFFLGALVTENYFAKGYVYFVMLVGLGFVLFNNYKGLTFSLDEERLIKFGIVSFLLVLVGFFQQHPELTRFAPGLENFAKSLLPILLIPMFYFLKLEKLYFLVISISIGCLVSMFNTFLGCSQGFARGGGEVFGAPIIFGDLSMLFGILSWVLSALYYHRNRSVFAWLISMGILGVAGSFCSGSRGGWIALVTLPMFLLPLVSKSYRQKLLLLFLTAFMFLFLIVFFTDNEIKIRLLSAWLEFQNIVFGSGSNGSLGQRVQMWHVAWQVFLTSPIFGIGIGEFYAVKMHLIQTGLASADILRYKHAHSEYLSILSNQGLLGISFYILFFTWLFRVFGRALKSKVLEIKVLGAMGGSVLLSYMDFSLSESFLSSHMGGAAFYFLTSIIIYFIVKLEKSQDRNALYH